MTTIHSPRIVGLLLLVVALASSGAATHHSSWCTPSTSSPEVDVGVPNAELGSDRYYVDNDFGYDMWSIWIYKESNGQPGLQRQDEIVDDTCGHPELGDTIIF